MKTRITQRLAAGAVAVTAAVALGVVAAPPAFADGPRPCSSTYTQVGFWVNPFWPVVFKISVIGSSFQVRAWGTGIPPYWETGLVNGSADVFLSPSVGTTVEIRCTTPATFRF